MFIKLSKILYCLVSFSILCQFVAINTKAQAYRGLIIDAFRIDIEEIKPGESITKSFNVTYDYQPNEDGTYKEVVLDFRTVDFTQGDKPGVPKFLDKSEVSETARISDWITFERDTITLSEPQQSEQIIFTINVPEYAEPGGKYCVVLISNREGDKATEQLMESGRSGFGLNGELGPLVFTTVTGDTKKVLDLKNVFTTNIKEKKSSLFFNPPINVVIEFENKGNVHVTPQGRVFIHKGEDFNNYLATYELNETSGTVLPNTTRQYIFPWDDSFINTVKQEVDGKVDYSTEYNWDNLSKLRMGKYNITVLYSYKNMEGEIIQGGGEASFWVIPLPLIIIISLLILVTLSVSFVIYQKRGKKKKFN